MSPDAPSPAPIDPQQEALLIDHLRGELDAPTARVLERRLAADAGLAAEHARLRDLFALEAQRFVADQRRASADAPRFATYIVSRVRADEAAARSRHTAVGATRRRWARLLAVSIGLHVVVLGVLAWRLHRERPADAEPAIAVAYEPTAGSWDTIPEEALAERVGRVLSEMTPEDLESLPGGVLRFDGQVDEALELQLEDVVRRAGQGPDYQFPPGTGLALSRRSNEALKRRRLAALGFDADGTLSKVRLGLNYLRSRQQANGAFAGQDAPGTVYETSVALLAFLGDGSHSKRDDDAGASVRRGIGWLRSAAFDDEGAVRTSLQGRDLGVVLVALSEDYMLSYGRLGMSEARSRGDEIARLAEAVRGVEAQIGEETAPGSAEAVWPVWALHAAERTGVTERSHAQRMRFQTWVIEAAGAETLAAGVDTVRVLSRGTALLSAERGGDKPGFTSWSASTAEGLLNRLLPNGKAKGADPGDPRVAETALTLLALQTAYRVY